MICSSQTHTRTHARMHTHTYTHTHTNTHTQRLVHTCTHTHTHTHQTRNHTHTLCVWLSSCQSLLKVCFFTFLKKISHSHFFNNRLCMACARERQRVCVCLAVCVCGLFVRMPTLSSTCFSEPTVNLKWRRQIIK